METTNKTPTLNLSTGQAAACVKTNEAPFQPTPRQYYNAYSSNLKTGFTALNILKKALKALPESWIH
jgi:hypothetical protein